MKYIKINSDIHNADSSLLINEIASTIIEPYGKDEFKIEKYEESIPNTKGIITTAVAIDFAIGVVQGLAVNVIAAIVSRAVKKIFTKKEANSIQISVEDSKIIVKSNGDINIEIEVTIE